MIRRLINRAQRRARDLRSDAGFTLVEIIIAVSLLGLVTGAGVTSLVTATRGSSALSLSAHESSDAQLISAFLVRDAQAAGGTDPETGITDPTLGVSASNSAGCAPAGTLVARFKWRDRKSTGSDEKVASYGLNGVHELVRRVCTNNVSGGDLLLGTNVASAALTCDGAAGACPAFPKFVTLSLSGTNTANPFSYQLTAQLRSESQDAPSTNNSAPVPILALGGTTCPQSGAFIDMNGTNNLTVDLGGVLVNTSLAGCKGLSINNNSTYSTDSTSVLTGPGAPCLPLANCPAITGYPTPLLDPLRNLPVPPEAAQCLGSGTNPAKIGTHYQAGVYYTLVTTNSGDTFDGGTYVFCNGLKISGDLTAANVLLYFAGGTLDMINTPRVTLGPQTSGPYANVSIWLPKTNTQTKLTINGNTGISLYSGIVYSPATTVYIGGGAEVRIASIIAYAIVLTGNGHEVFGPGVSITTPQIAAFINVPYTMQLTAEGGTSPYSAWSIYSGALPTGLSLNTATGLISGTPTVPGPFTVTFQISDSIPRVTRRTYTFNVGTGALTIVTSSLKEATLTAQYSMTLQALSDAGTYTWSATSLPAGLALDSNLGIISGVPTGPTANVTLTVTDLAGFQTTKTLMLTVNLPPSITTYSLPDTTVTALYSRTISSTDGTALLSWGIKAGDSLPLGLVLNGAVISGTVAPNAVGTTFSVVLTDLNGAQAIRQYTIQVNPAPVITSPAALPGWAVGAGGYPSTTITATGGTGSYNWSWTAPTLPPGLTISSAGVISGTPTAAGSYGAIAVKVTDGVGVSVTRTYSITITGALSITAPTNLPNWDAGAAYPTTTPTAGGGSGGFVWSSSTLPPGLVINPSSGAITGTPTTAGPYSAVVLKVTDSNGVIATRSYSMTVYSPLAFTGPGSLPSWVAGIGYPQQTATVSGGSGSNTWTASGLPPGLTLSPAGLLTGTPSPTGIGTYASIVLSVGDGTGGGFNIGPYSITIFPALAINTGGVPSNGIVGAPFTGSLSASGGSGNFSWSAAGLPAGVTISPAGVLSGTPQTNAAYTATFTLTDNGTGGTGGQPATTSVTLPINTYQPLGWGILPTPPAAWTAGFAYPTQTFVTTGGASVTWLITGLPAGMSSSGGAISGTPSTAGATTVTVKATDSIGQTLTRTFSLTINSTLTLSQSSPPPTAWTAGRPYPSVTYTTAGGTPAVSVGATGVPAGMSFSGGVLSGTPTTAGSSSVTVTATDAGGGTRTSSFALTINAAPSLSGTLPVGDQSIGYSSSLSLTGGTGPLTWTAPTKPAFLSINASTGLLTGTPVSAGSFPVTVTVTDATGATATANVTLTVRPPTPISISLNNGTGTVKKIDQGDTIVITYSQALDLATVCPGGALPLAGNGNVTVTVNNGAGAANDTITVTAASCTGVGGLHLGAINLGSGAFVSANTTFSGSGNASNLSTISWVANALTITLGKQSPANSSVVVSVPNTATYAPDPAMKSSAGVFVSGTASVTGSSPNFFF